MAVDGGEHRDAIKEYQRCIEMHPWAVHSPEERTKQGHPCDFICERSDPVPLWRRIQQIQMHLEPNQSKSDQQSEGKKWEKHLFQMSLIKDTRFHEVRKTRLNVPYVAVCCSLLLIVALVDVGSPGLLSRNHDRSTFASAGRTGRS